MLKLKQRLNSIISKHTGKNIEQVEKDCDRDNFMSSDEAKAYGLVDEVVQSRKEIPDVDGKSSASKDLISPPSQLAEGRSERPGTAPS